MASRNASAGLALLALGIAIGVVYPFLLVYLDRERALDLLRYSVAAASITIGAFLGAIGIILLRGFKPSERPEDTG